SPVQFEEESLKNVLSLFSDEVRINMFVSPEVEGEVTLRLGKPTPFLDALEAILTQNYCQYEIEGNIIKVSRMPILSQSFSLQYALASTLTPSIDTFLSAQGNSYLDEATNTVIVKDKKEKIEEIAAFIAELDTPEKQLKRKSFSIRFLPVDRVASLLEDYLSAEGKVKVDPLANTLLLAETSRNFAQLEELILNLDVYQSKEEIFTLEYALASSVAPRLTNYLGPEDGFEINDQENEIIVSSDLYTLKKIKGLLDSLDTPEAQLTEETYPLKYLGPEEAWNKLDFKEMVSKHASYEVVDSYEVEKEGSTERKEVEKEYVRIPREIVDNSETERVPTAVSSAEENMGDKQSVVYIVIRDLKRNQQKIREAIEEINRGEEIINQTFYIEEGSLERIALAMANILGIEPGDIEGLEPKGEWMQMEVPTVMYSYFAGITS
ncbi:unnamed protein product, partial [marine sediment metagenome]